MSRDANTSREPAALDGDPAADQPARPVTASDVARLAGVSRSAVSRTFTPGASVAPATRERVLAAAHALNYRVNLLARGLINQRSDLVGVVVAGSDNPFRSTQITALTKAIQAAGFRPMIVHAEPDALVDPVIGQLLHYQVAGVIVTSGSPPSLIVDECSRFAVPLLLINRPAESPGIDSLVCDSVAGTRAAFTALRQSGAGGLLVVAPEQPSFALAERLETFQHLAQADGAVSIVLRTDGNDYASGFATGRHMELDPATAPWGAFVVSDFLALGFVDGVRATGRHAVPEDLRVVGFDDVPMAGWAAYDLATIRQPPERMAELAVEVLEARLHDPQRPAERRVCPVSLVWRPSLGTAPKD